MHPSPKCRPQRVSKLIAAFGFAVLPCFGMQASAAIVATANPVDGFGESPAIMTVDPYNTAVFSATASRGVAADRKLRQTFQNPATFNVGDITIAYNGEPGGVTGMTVRIYQIEDVLGSADQFSPANLFRELTYDGVVPDSATHLRLSLTGASVFSLPARGSESDNLGYAIEFATRFSSPSDPSIGQVVFSNDANGFDGYVKGRYYTETGATGTGRDIGLSFLVSTQPTFLPGDTNGDNIVDVATDLQAIASNFRKTVVDISSGDLNGDTYVDFDDFQIWKDNYTGPVPASALAFLKVPEPGAAVVAAMGLLTLAARRRRVASR
jgi:hypothetical protein